MSPPGRRRDERTPVDTRLLRTRDLDRPAPRGARLHDRAHRRRCRAGRRSRRVPGRPLPAAAPGRGGLAGRRPAPAAGCPPRPSGHVAAGPTPAGLRGPRGHPDHATRSRRCSQALRRLRAAGLAERHAGRRVRATRGIEPPGDLETAIEAPYRLVVSPSARGAFRHSSTPVGPARPRRALAHPPDGPDRRRRYDDDDADQRIVRALWTRDSEQPAAGLRPAAHPVRPHGDRRARPTAATPTTPTRRCWSSSLSLSSLGAWFDWKQSWEFPANIVDYRHQAFMGRDGYVRVAYPGFLFPFGHRCFLVKITEREIKHRDDARRLPVAAVVHHRPPAHAHATRRPTSTTRSGRSRVSPLVTPGHRQAARRTSTRSCPPATACRSRSR